MVRPLSKNWSLSLLQLCLCKKILSLYLKYGIEIFPLTRNEYCVWSVSPSGIVDYGGDDYGHVTVSYGISPDTGWNIISHVVIIDGKIEYGSDGSVSNHSYGFPRAPFNGTDKSCFVRTGDNTQDFNDGFVIGYSYGDLSGII